MIRLKRPGFTLLELLVIISIISVLVSLAFLQAQKAQITARNTRAQSDLVALGKAVEQFKTDNGEQIYQAIGTTAQSGDQLTGTTDFRSFKDLFANQYHLEISSTPAGNYTYSYITSPLPRDAMHSPQETSLYPFY